MKEIGKQYERQDNLEDKSKFKSSARLLQSKYRAEKLKLDFDKYGNYLTKADGERGENFYPDFKIFDAVKNYRPYNKNLYSNMLRSEHIPFNFFIPLRDNLEFCKNVFNKILDGCIKSIEEKAIIDNKENIKIEFAPKPKGYYLNDGTSFDSYIEYTHKDNSKGIIGIEVKYTEQEYKLKLGSTEDKAIDNDESDYFRVTNNEQRKLYKSGNISKLKSDEFRQIWRNHLLGESILLFKPNEFKHFSSITFFPNGNKHFVETSKKYIDMLQSNDNRFLPITYEEFFKYLNEYSPNNKFSNWIKYLQERYI